jgi:hypothetical protein
MCHTCRGSDGELLFVPDQRHTAVTSAPIYDSGGHKDEPPFEQSGMARFEFSEYKMNRMEADAYCRNQGGRIAVIRNIQDLQLVRHVIGTRRVVTAALSGGGHWFWDDSSGFTKLWNEHSFPLNITGSGAVQDMRESPPDGHMYSLHLDS